MPLSEPSGADFTGGVNGAYFSRINKRNTGADIAINFQGTFWDDVNSRILVAGNNDYVGSIASVYGKLTQAPTLPATNNTMIGITLNRVNSGALCLDGINAVFRSDSALDNWATITPPAATSRNGGIFTLADDSNIYIATVNLAAPARNIEVSGDNGLTWDSDPGLLAPVTTSCRAVLPARDGSLVVIVGDGDAAVTSDPVAAVYEVFTSAAAAANSAVAISDDNTKIVIGSTTGEITVIDGLTAGNEAEIAIANNPFQQTATNGLPIQAIEYIPALGGFILINLSQEVVGFIDEDNMTICEEGLMTTDTAPTAPANIRMGIAAVDNSGDVIIMGTANLALVRVT